MMLFRMLVASLCCVGAQASATHLDDSLILLQLSSKQLPLLFMNPTMSTHLPGMAPLPPGITPEMAMEYMKSKFAEHAMLPTPRMPPLPPGVTEMALEYAQHKFAERMMQGAAAAYR